LAYRLYEIQFTGYLNDCKAAGINCLSNNTAGLKYIEIIEIPPFDNLKLPSLGKLYRDARARLKNKKIREPTEEMKVKK
jgi:hypothetical protein